MIHWAWLCVVLGHRAEWIGENLVCVRCGFIITDKSKKIK